MVSVEPAPSFSSSSGAVRLADRGGRGSAVRQHGAQWYAFYEKVAVGRNAAYTVGVMTRSHPNLLGLGMVRGGRSFQRTVAAPPLAHRQRRPSLLPSSHRNSRLASEAERRTQELRLASIIAIGCAFLPRSGSVCPRRARRKDTMRHKSENALAMATRHVRQSEGRVARQRQVVEKLRADGHDTTKAENILAMLEALLRQHREHLTRLVARNLPLA
jgi:hypothetical protein